MAEQQTVRKFSYASLSTSFFIASILGFLISTVYIPKVSITWAFTLGIFFLLMLLASFISMLKGQPELQFT